MGDSNVILYDRLAPIGGLGLPGIGLSAGGTPAPRTRPTGGDGDAR
jgi:hypothetical protein